MCGEIVVFGIIFTLVIIFLDFIILYAFNLYLISKSEEKK